MILVIEKVEKDTDRKKLEQWYKSYKNLLYKIAYDYTKEYDKAEDLLNEAFVHIIRHMDTIAGLDSRERATYFVTTMRNVCIDYMRKKNREKDYSSYADVYCEETLNKAEEQEPETLNPENTYLKKEFYEKLGGYMLQLSQRDRDILIMKLKMDLSEKEIAKQMGIKEQNIHSYYRRAKDRLKKIMNEDIEYEL
jgi:RNA polymerase sigma-70 factor (ECF subfamily)